MKVIINIPNSLSLARIALIPVLFLLIVYSTDKNYPILIGLFFLSVMFDFFDGYLARKLNQESDFGKILDPLADKLLIFFVILALVIKAGFPIWLALVIFLRDVIILLAGLILMKERKKISASILVGKVTFGVLGALLMVYIIDLPQSLDLEILKRFFTVLSLSFIAWSWVEYYKVYKRENNGK